MTINQISISIYANWSNWPDLLVPTLYSYYFFQSYLPANYFREGTPQIENIFYLIN